MKSLIQGREKYWKVELLKLTTTEFYLELENAKSGVNFRDGIHYFQFCPCLFISVHVNLNFTVIILTGYEYRLWK
jgi:hypothetical protein